MKHLHKLLWALALTACLLALSACGPTADSTEPSTTPEELAAALRAQYNQAADYLAGAENFYATVNTSKHTTTGTYLFTESSQQAFSFLHYGTDYMLADLEETYCVGSHTVSISEHFDNGVCALQIEGAGFVSQLSASQYAARFVPLRLLTESLYGNVSSHKENDLLVLTFSQASGPEAWTGIDSQFVTDIVAQAVLNADGRLVESRYTITYTSGQAVVEYSVTASLDTDYVPTLQAFPDTAQYVKIDDPDIPKLLEQATGYVLHASSVTSSFSEKINCQAAGIYRTQQAILDLLVSDSDLKARLERTYQLVDYTQNGSTRDLTQVELFLNDVYSKNGQAVSGKDASQMLTYCRDTLVFPILLPKHITGMTVTETEDTWVLEFDTTRELSDVIRDYICYELYKDPDVLNNLASSYQMNYASGKLVLDKYTGLPVEASLRYSGTHTIAGYAYELSYELTQSYDLTSQTAYAAITGQSPEAATPEN